MLVVREKHYERIDVYKQFKKNKRFIIRFDSRTVYAMIWGKKQFLQQNGIFANTDNYERIRVSVCKNERKKKTKNKLFLDTKLSMRVRFV